MTDREKLIELFDHFGIKDWKEQEYMVDHLIANGVTVQRWIPAKERLPDNAETVLTYKNGIIEVQVYEKMRNGWINGNWFWSMATVTHWMPLPEPPKEEV